MGPRRGMVLSDLHLFARRSRGMALVKGLKHELAALDLLVLNGDIFDFRWSYHPGRLASQAAAAAWLGRLHDAYPRCQIHLVLGNHDGLVSFQEELARLAPSLARFHWHADCLQLGAALFLHGDCAQARMDARRLAEYRQAWEHKGNRGAWGSGAYRCADWLGLTRLVHQWHFPHQRTVRRIAYYLDHARPGWRREVRDCYFGHTHLPMSRFEFEGVRFHNTGAAVGRLGFHPIFFELPATNG